MKNPNSIEWLQLSDLHLFDGTDWNLMKREYKKLAQILHPDFLIITGDYRHVVEDQKTGYNLDYSEALKFLNDLREIFQLKKKDMFLIPGNHDVNVNGFEGRQDIINRILKDIDSDKDVYRKQEEGKDILLNAFTEYNSFVEAFYKGAIKDDRASNPAGVNYINWESKLNLLLMNTALISDNDRSHPQIADVYAVSALEAQANLPTIAIGHHVFKDLHPLHQEALIKSFSDLNVKAYLCGDTHRENLTYIMPTDITSMPSFIPCINCAKSAVQPKDSFSELGAIYYKWEEDGYVTTIPYRWQKTSGKLFFIKGDEWNVGAGDEDIFKFEMNAKNAENKIRIQKEKEMSNTVTYNNSKHIGSTIVGDKAKTKDTYNVRIKNNAEDAMSIEETVDSLDISYEQKKELLEIINKALSESEEGVSPEKSVAKGKFETFIKMIGDKAKKIAETLQSFSTIADILGIADLISKLK